MFALWGDRPMAAVLIIDSHAAIVSCIAAMLRQGGHEAEGVATKAAAAAILARQAFDAVLIDAGLDASEGPETVALVRQFDPDAACLLLCASARLPDHEASRCGVFSQI